MRKNIQDISNQTIAGLLVVGILAVLGFMKGPFWKWTKTAAEWLWCWLTATIYLPVWALLLIVLVVALLVVGVGRWRRRKASGSSTPSADPRVSQVQIEILKQLAKDDEYINMEVLPAPSTLRLTHALDELEDFELVRWGYFGPHKKYSLTHKGRDFVIRHGWG